MSPLAVPYILDSMVDSTFLAHPHQHIIYVCVCRVCGVLSMLMAGHEIEMQAMKNSSISTWWTPWTALIYGQGIWVHVPTTVVITTTIIVDKIQKSLPKSVFFFMSYVDQQKSLWQAITKKGK